MGRVLEKFSLRHRFWLEAMGSPLVKGGEVRMLDIELATRICAMRFEDLDRDLPRMIGRGPGLCGKLHYVWKAAWRGAEKEYRDFQNYLIDHGCPPKTWGNGEMVMEGGEDEEDAGPEPDDGVLPGLLSLVTGVIRGSGWDPNVTWALSPGEAEWYLAGIFTHRGIDVNLKSGADEKMEEMLRDRKAAAEAVEDLSERV